MAELKISKRLLCLLLAAILLLCSAPTAFAQEGDKAPESEELLSLPVYIDALLSARAFNKNGSILVPMDALCHALDMEMSFYEEFGVLHVIMEGFELTAVKGSGYMVANGRYLYAPEGWLIRSNFLYLPHDALSRIFGIEAKLSEDMSELHYDCGGASLIQGGDSYYEDEYSIDDIYWLSHIIDAESRHEPLAGKIGVGNVVFNRIASPEYPDTILGVVYDTQGVVQFEPVQTGDIRGEPWPESMAATYLCFEGYNTVGDCLFFVNPAYGSYWFDENLELVLVINNHNFYRKPLEKKNA